MKKLFFSPIFFLLFFVLIFFGQFVKNGKLPIPSDTIVGLYHPFRDLYAREYSNGIPFKNFLITDPVRQQYSWRELGIDIFKTQELPLWNPYSFAGTPLLANFQSASFYPLNIIFLLMSFEYAWSILVITQPLLAGVFLYLYLTNLRINKIASLFGSISFSFSGFAIAWMEWNTILHTALWLPFILLSIDKIFFYPGSSNSTKFKIQSSKLQFKIKSYYAWCFIFIFSLASSLLAGHLQTFFYVFLVSVAYFFARWLQYGKKFNILFVFLLFNFSFLILTAIQWIPTFQLILQSAREIDLVNWHQEGWFIPWQHLVQFIAPDFFGNPTTLNYWGVWNYGELVGYVGIAPLIMAFLTLFFRQDKKTLFFGTLFFMSLIFSLPTFFAQLPFILNIPFLSTAQPTRLLFITDFTLSILAAFGLDYFIKNGRKIVYPLIFLFVIFAGLWAFVLWGNNQLQITSLENIAVTKRNLFFPTSVFIALSILILILKIFQKTKNNTTIIIYIIIGITVFDLLRFGQKFNPFTNKEYLFPQTKALSFLQKQEGNFRIMTTDSKILPPNFSAIYKLQSVDGYDPLYLRRYGELIAASERGEPNISPPFGFNRIITPHNYDSRIIDLLGVRYILSLSDLQSLKLTKVFEEGQTRVYENKNAYPRVFFAKDIKRVDGKQQAIDAMFSSNIDLQKTAIVEKSTRDEALYPTQLAIGKARIISYEPNKIVIETENEGEGFLVLTDSFYSSWRVTIDGNKSEIFRTNFQFRGVSLLKGNHQVVFSVSLL